MISADENNVNIQQCAAPLTKRCEHRLRSARFCMQQIAKENDALRLHAQNDRREPLDRFARCSRRNWNSLGAKCRCLSPVWIGD